MLITDLVDAQLRFVSSIGDKNFVLAIFVLIGVVVLRSFGYKKESWLLALTTLSFVASYILKFIFKHPRPITAHLDFPLDYYSFPSSHVMAYTVIFGYVCYLTFKLKKMDKFLKFVLHATSIYFVGLVGVSRVYLGQHFPEDVYAGYGFGLIYLLLVIFLDKTSKNSVSKNKN